jgi:hypothetical protein
MHLPTKVHHEPAVNEVSIMTLFSKVREFGLQQRSRKCLKFYGIFYATKIAILELNVVINFKEFAKLPINLSVWFGYTFEWGFYNNSIFGVVLRIITNLKPKINKTTKAHETWISVDVFQYNFLHFIVK